MAPLRLRTRGPGGGDGHRDDGGDTGGERKLGWAAVSNEGLSEPIAKEKDDGDPEQPPGDKDTSFRLGLVLAKRHLAAWHSHAHRTPPPEHMYRL